MRCRTLTETRSEPITITGETLIAAWAALATGLLALGYCVRHGLLLLYGDAVAHLYIARRIVDSMNPGLNQLGSVWLPLPHLLLSPFVQNDYWWRTGLAGAWISLPCYVLSCAGMYRLARLWLPLPSAAVATAFYGLNPGLLYMATTAMTEPLFLAEMIWAVVLIVQFQRTLELRRKAGEVSLRRKRGAAPSADAEKPPISVRRQLLRIGWLLVAAVLTRYDGWIYAAVAWLIVTISIIFTRSVQAPLHRRMGGFHPFGDCRPHGMDGLQRQTVWRSAGLYARSLLRPRDRSQNIRERRGESPGHEQPARFGHVFSQGCRDGSHPSPFCQHLLWWTIAGTLVAAYRFRRQAIWPALLLWLPLPFYAYSIAYGSVPLFIPIWMALLLVQHALWHGIVARLRIVWRLPGGRAASACQEI